MTPLFVGLLLAAQQTAPYQSVTVPDGSSVSIYVDCGDPNKGQRQGGWQFFQELSGVGWFSYLGNRWEGWNGETRFLDGSVVLQNVWVQALSAKPWGALDSQNRVWPDEDGAIRIYTNGSTLDVTVYGSPAESVRLVGNDNFVRVNVRSGEQSIYKLPRPGVHINGDRNTLTGYIEFAMAAVYSVGFDNVFKDLELVCGAVGDDIGGLYLQGHEKLDGVTKTLGYYHGARIENVTVRQKGREYPWSHGINAVYFDDGFSDATIYNLQVYGDWTRRYFVNGGTNVVELTKKNKGRGKGNGNSSP